MAYEEGVDPRESKVKWLIPLAFGIILVSVLIVCGVVFGVVLTRPRKSSPQGGTNVTAQPRVTTTMKPLPDMNVIIIGAGMAGLAAARTLHDQGVPFTILEASNRVGGRMMDVNFHGYTVELGANWVQGTEGNPIWDLAKEANLTGIMTDWESYTVRNSTGHDVTDEADDEYDRLLSVAEEKIVEIALEKGKDKETDLSVRGALRSVGWIPTTPVQNAIEYFDYDYEMGDIPKMTSLRYGAFKTHDAFEDEEYLVTDQRGFSYMARYYAGKFLSQNDTRLKLGEWVTDVSYGPNGARVLTKSGTEYQPDFVISTVSLGVLQRKGINFSPEFPEWKDTVLHKHLMTTFLKIYIKFPDNITAFWDETESIIYAGQRRGYYSAWLNVNAEGVHKGANILCVIVTEREAFRIDTMTDQQVLAEIMEVLRNMYGQGIPEAEDIIVPRLHSDPLQYGSYSNWPYGMLGEDFKAFKAPLDRLYFAGEAFSDDYFGYIHGAYFSGIETAEEVLKCMRGSCKNFVPKAETCYVK